MSSFAPTVAVLLVAALCYPRSMAGQPQAYMAAPAPAPLFASSEVLEATLMADFAALDDDRGEVRPRRPGSLRFIGPDGAPVQLEVAVRTRGNFRLRRSTCSFPNLRLEFPETTAAEGTIFTGQEKLKLVGHCRRGREYEQNTLEEFLVYRLYNVVTDASFRVRLARLTYLDVNGAIQPLTRYGFLLEDVDALAARLGGVALEAREVHPLQLDPVASVQQELFQYMVGNTDFSAVFSHNTELVGLPNGTYQAVPYDFDFAGIVDARYAMPDTSLGTRSVRERVYRGFCRPGVDWTAIYAHFSERRAAFEAVIRGLPELDARAADRAVRYLDDFFKTLESPRARRNLVERQCRVVPG